MRLIIIIANEFFARWGCFLYTIAHIDIACNEACGWANSHCFSFFATFNSSNMRILPVFFLILLNLTHFYTKLIAFFVKFKFWCRCFYFDSEHEMVLYYSTYRINTFLHKLRATKMGVRHLCVCKWAHKICKAILLWIENDIIRFNAPDIRFSSFIFRSYTNA